VRELLARTRDPATENDEGITPRDYAARNEHLEALELLERRRK
jgi:ankyrin repeat protein